MSSWLWLVLFDVRLVAVVGSFCRRTASARGGGYWSPSAGGLLQASKSCFQILSLVVVFFLFHGCRVEGRQVLSPLVRSSLETVSLTTFPEIFHRKSRRSLFFWIFRFYLSAQFLASSLLHGLGIVAWIISNERRAQEICGS